MKNKRNIETLVAKLTILDLREKKYAALGLNESFVWARFVLTDDQPNGNNQRIPKSEFPNLIRSGLYTPIKMKAGQIGEGHEESYPIGVVTTLREDTRGDVNLVVGLAALWSEERPEDVATISEMYANKKPLDVSWEVSHASTEETDDGITDIKGVILTGTTLVKIPAYGGRTFIDELLFASKDDSKNNDPNLEEDKTLENKNFEELKTSYAEIVTEAANLTHTIETLQTENDSLKENQITDDIKSELKTLRTFKEEAEAALELEEKRVGIRKYFEEAGLEVDEKYFEENDALLTGMKDEEVEFFVQSLQAAQTPESDDGKTKASFIPKINTDKDDDIEGMDASSLGKALYAQKYEDNK